MKKYILITLLIFNCLNTIAQNHQIKLKPNTKIFDPNKFTGIGIFKIGIDTNVLMAYAEKNVEDIVDCNDFSELQNKRVSNITGGRLELIRLKTADSGSIGADVIQSYCPFVTQYVLTAYKINGDLIITNIRLTFFKNSLVKFESDYDKLIEDALTVKYGDGELKVTETKSSCYHNLTGITTPLIAKEYSKEWYNGLITVYSDLFESYDDNCKKEIHTFFLYSVENKLWENCESSGLDKSIKDGNSPKIKKSELNNF
ncbi:hypothetical protein SAMN05216490_1883 [Mucilaginibacter mallensis]|uniref:DUF4468 domain-containing protein n=1 Tax=Mucilaginibacter mallensis TaxID=652787 RepID=A0A1H1VBP5_MUCMA|nr:hypothetical protein [Mucilaginibacter mallensis]SDS82192.1 hypothetical protein SAMN05216490_1883 [Mucilaginibacter mallensis]